MDFGTDPMAQYYQTLATDLNSKQPGVSTIAANAAAQAPTIAASQLQFAQTEQQMGNLGPQLQQQGDYSTLMAQNQLQGIGINYAQQGLQRQGTEQQYGATVQSQQEQAQKNALQYARQMQGEVQGSAASGVLNTGGSTQRQGDITQQAQWSAADLARQEKLSAGDFARAEQNFNLMGQANGLSAAEVKERLAYGLNQMGLAADPSQLAAQAGGILSGGMGAQASALSQAGLEGGFQALAGLG